ncbi:MAG: creatininase family protein [Candidatus Odinarchaeia archaeon]
MVKVHNLFECTYVDFQEWVKKTDIVLVPIGACEQHGPHCPLGCDGIEAEVTAKKAAEKADVPHTPLIWMGYSVHHMGKWPTITLRAETLQGVLYDVARSLIHHGFNKIVFICGHTSNLRAMDPVLRKIRNDTGALVAVYPADSAHTIPLFEELVEGPDELPGWHGAEIEASEMLAYNPNLVHLDRLKKENIPNMPHRPDYLTDKFSKSDGRMNVFFEGYEVIMPLRDHEYINMGFMGNPFRASKEKGEKIFEIVSSHCAKFINELKKIQVTVKNREFTEAT